MRTERGTGCHGKEGVETDKAHLSSVSRFWHAQQPLHLCLSLEDGLTTAPLALAEPPPGSFSNTPGRHLSCSRPLCTSQSIHCSGDFLLSLWKPFSQWHPEALSGPLSLLPPGPPCSAATSFHPSPKSLGSTWTSPFSYLEPLDLSSHAGHWNSVLPSWLSASVSPSVEWDGIPSLAHSGILA